jgi:hypothetical protein
MKSHPVIFHGSENSLDRDAYVIVPEPMAIQEAKSLCEQYPALNANIITVDNGQVSWCYKGTIGKQPRPKGRGFSCVQTTLD